MRISDWSSDVCSSDLTLGVPIENVEIVHGDTGSVPMGMGTYGPRSLAVGGSAIAKACDKIIENSRKIAAPLMEASVENGEFDKGKLRVAAPDKETSDAETDFPPKLPPHYPTTIQTSHQH